MGFHLALSRADKDAILEAYLAGEKAIVIATRFNVHQTTPGKLAKSKGLPLRQPQNSTRKIMIEIDLPVPPSVNNLFFNRPGGRTITPKYKAWQTEAGWMLQASKPPAIKGPVALMYTFEEGRADLGNLEKPVTDLLVTHKLIDGDGPKVVKQISMSFGPVKGVKVKVFAFT